MRSNAPGRSLLFAVALTSGACGGGGAKVDTGVCGAANQPCCGGVACNTIDLTCSAGTCVGSPFSTGGSSSSGGKSSSSGSGTTHPGSSSSSSSSGSSGSGSSSSSSSGFSSSASGGAFVTIDLTGCPFIGYNAPVTVGGQAFQMGIDTGSTDTGVALSTCTSCGVAPEYSPASGTCSGSTSAQYGSGSWDAEVCTATVSVGAELPDVSIYFAGITDQSQFFINTDCAGNPVATSLSEGILGLGPIDLDSIGMSTDDAYFNQLVQQGITDTLAVLLCSANGELWFGGYDSQFASGSPQYTPMNTSSGYWAVSLSSIGLGSTNLGGADPNSVVDTGTWGFYMPTAAFDALVNALSTDSGAASVFGSGAMSSTFFSEGECLSPNGGQTQSEIDAALQPLTLTFPTAAGGSFTLTLPATESYLIPVTSGGVTAYCAGVGDNAMLQGQTIIGDAALRANITIFDEGNTQVGFVPQSYCQ